MEPKSKLDETAMSQEIAIVDRGRGPQLSTSRLTVLDVFYYLNRGCDFEFIHQAMPSLTRAEFDLVAAYVGEHHEELAEKDRRIDEYHQRCKEELRAKGLYKEIDHSVPFEARLEQLRAKMKQRRAEKNGGLQERDDLLGTGRLFLP
jgi:hypothetical protein